MKPYLMLLLAISLVIVKPVHAQRKEINRTAAPSTTIRPAVDTSFISVNIDWDGFASCPDGLPYIKHLVTQVLT